MVSGIQVYNNNNILQITDQFSNIQFIEKQTVTLPTRIRDYYANAVTRYYTDLILPAISKDMYAFRCDNGKFVQCFGTRKYLGSGNYGPLTLTIGGEQGAIVTVYRFSHASIPIGDHFEVRDENNNLVFSDKGRFMKVIDSKSGVRVRPTALGSVLETTVHNIDIVTAVSSGYMTREVDYDDYSYHGAIKQQSFTFQASQTVSTFEAYYIANSPNYHHDRTVYDVHYQYLVLDVTGL